MEAPFSKHHVNISLPAGMPLTGIPRIIAKTLAINLDKGRNVEYVAPVFIGSPKQRSHNRATHN
jgi:hypothetical protein